MDRGITVGIPTYDREEFVVGVAASVADAGFETLVVDDGSTDGTFAAVSSIPGVRVVRNEANQGYARTLLRLFEETTTPYLVVVTDDDRVLVDRLGELEAFVTERRPAVVSTQFHRAGRLMRGEAQIRSLLPSEYKRAAGHAPGLVYNVEAARATIEEVRARIDLGCVATTVYPQVMVVALLLARGEPCLWWDKPVVEDGALLPSGIRDDGDPYTAIASRWRQEQAFLDFLADKANRAPPEERERWAAMLAVQRQFLFSVLRGALEYERPDLVRFFDEGAIAHGSSRSQQPRRGILGLWPHSRTTHD